MIEKIPFGRTGHESTRTLFGAAALGGMSPERAEGVLTTLLEHGVNHIDTAASYGDSELRLAPWLAAHRASFFLATKTDQRTGPAARAQLERSLERMEVGQVDLIQMHNLVDEREWETAMGPGGALEALIDARAEGLVRFIGVTGHGTRVAAMHLRSLERFDFDSVLLPYNFTMMQQAEYAADVEALLEICSARNVAVQTIKAVARRRWAHDAEPTRRCWYEPIEDEAAFEQAVHFVLAREQLFLNTSSDVTVLERTLAAADRFFAGAEPVDEARLTELLARAGAEPLFVPGLDDVGRAPA